MTKKFPLFITFLLFAPLVLFAQDIEYYKSIAKSTSNKQVKLEALDSVLSKSFRNDKDTFIDYSFEYIELAKEMDSIELAAKKAMNLQYPLTNSRDDPRKAVTTINGVLAHKYKISDSFLLGGLYLKRGSAHFRIDSKKAVEDYTLALENFSPGDSIHAADAYLFRGQANSNLGNFVQAGEDYKKAYNYYENLKDYEYMLYAQQGNITMFSKNGFFEIAKRERTELIEKLIELNLEKYLANEYYNQALDYKKIGNDSLQLASLQKAQENLVDLPSSKGQYIAINSELSEYYSNRGSYEVAKTYLDRIESKYGEIRGDIYSELNYNEAKASYLEATGDLEKSLIYAQRKLENAISLGIEEEIMTSHLLLSKIYKKSGNYKKSLENKDAYGAIRDSLYNQSNANSLAYYQTLFDIQKKEKELVEKSTNIQLLEKDSETFKNLMFFVSLATVLIFGLILLYRNRQNLKNNKTLQEKFSQELIVSQEEERMRISKDLHDGLGQQLLLIKNKLIATGDKNTKVMVDNAIEEVRTISRDLHPFQLQELGITKAIEHTVTQIDENTTLFISSEIDNIDNLFTPEEEVNIYRIVQESLSNIIKHAKAEASKISVRKLSNSVNISIIDNGIGFEFTEKYQDSKSLGLKTLLERTKFLKGQMKVQSKLGTGTFLEYKFPVK